MKEKKKKIFIIIGILVVILIVIAVLALCLTKNKDTKNNSPQEEKIESNIVNFYTSEESYYIENDPEVKHIKNELLIEADGTYIFSKCSEACIVKTGKVSKVSDSYTFKVSKEYSNNCFNNKNDKMLGDFNGEELVLQDAEGSKLIFNKDENKDNSNIFKFSNESSSYSECKSE